MFSYKLTSFSTKIKILFTNQNTANCDLIAPAIIKWKNRRSLMRPVFECDDRSRWASRQFQEDNKKIRITLVPKHK